LVGASQEIKKRNYLQTKGKRKVILVWKEYR